MKLNLVENENDRQLVMKEENKPKLLEILRKLGNVTDYMTEVMVAEFYGVPNSTIQWYGDDKAEELEKYGYEVLRGKKLKKFKASQVELDNLGISKFTSQVRLHTIESVVVIGMMLTESEVAERLRNEIIKELFNETPTIDPLLANLNDIVKASRDNNDVQLAIAIGNRDRLIENEIVNKRIKPLENQIEELSPLAQKYNIFIDTEGLTDVETFSKNLGIKRLGRNNMYKYLRDKGYLMKNNRPYQKYIDNKYFTIKPCGNHIINEDVVQDYKTYITTKGVNKIIDELIKDRYINK